MITPNSSKLRILVALVLFVAPALAQEDPAGKNAPRSVLDGLTWAKLDLPESLKQEVTVFGKKRLRTPGRPAEFPPYRLSDLRAGVTWMQLMETYGESLEMPLPDSLKVDATSELPPFHITDLKEGLTWQEMFEWFDVAVDHPMFPNAFSFVLSDSETPVWKGACRWTQPRADRKGRMTVDCRYASIDGSERWKLDIEASCLVSAASERADGSLSDGKTTYRVIPLYDERHGFARRLPLAGYVLAAGQEPLAAASTSRAGERLIVKTFATSKDRSLLAAVAQTLARIPAMAARDPIVPLTSDATGFSFTLIDESTPVWRVACETWSDTAPASKLEEWSRNLERIGPVDLGGGWSIEGTPPSLKSFTIECLLVSIDGLHRKLEMSAATDGRTVTRRSGGQLTGEGAAYDVIPDHVPGHGKRMPLAGYFFTLEQRRVAAVGTHPMAPLIVHNSVAPQDRSLIAASALSLILMTPAGVK